MLLKYLKWFVEHDEVEKALRSPIHLRRCADTLEPQFGVLPLTKQEQLAELLKTYRGNRVVPGSVENSTGFTGVNAATPSADAVRNFLTILEREWGDAFWKASSSFGQLFCNTASGLSACGLEFTRLFVAAVVYRKMQEAGYERGFRSFSYVMTSFCRVAASPYLLEMAGNGRMHDVFETLGLPHRPGYRKLAETELGDLIRLVYGLPSEVKTSPEPEAAASGPEKSESDATPCISDLTVEFLSQTEATDRFRNYRDWLDSVRAWYRDVYLRRPWRAGDDAITQKVMERMVKHKLIQPCHYVVSCPDKPSMLDEFVAWLQSRPEAQRDSEQKLYVLARAYLRQRPVVVELYTVLVTEQLVRSLYGWHSSRGRHPAWPHVPAWGPERTVLLNMAQTEALRSVLDRLDEQVEDIDSLTPEHVYDWLSGKPNLDAIGVPFASQYGHDIRVAVLRGIAWVLHAALVNGKGKGDLSGVCSEPQAQVLEEKEQTMELRANWTINGQDVSKLTTAQIAAMISREETELAELDNIKTKPQRVIAEIKRRREELKNFVRHLDEADGVTEKPAKAKKAASPETKDESGSPEKATE